MNLTALDWIQITVFLIIMAPIVYAVWLAWVPIVGI